MRVGLFFPRFKYQTGDPPLGLSYVAASLLKNTEASVKVIDTTFMQNREAAESAISKQTFDLAGISVMSTMLTDALWMAGIIRKHNPHAKIYFGGPHCTVMPKETIAESCVDGIVIGEGEAAFTEIVNNNGNADGVKGVWYKKDGELIQNEPRTPEPDLDQLAFPARELLDMDNYFRDWFQLDSISAGMRGTNILGTRGCPYACSFCQPTLNQLFGKKLRKRSAENIVGELKLLKEQYGIQGFIFADDTLNIDRKWLHRLCDTMINEKLGLLWGCNIRANLVNYDDLKLMKEAGLRKIFFGIESANANILKDMYQKGITLEQVKNAVDIAKSLDIKVQGYFMLGAPSETPKDLRNTIRFAMKLDIDDATFSITTPLPGTFLYDKTKESVDKPIVEFDYYKNYVYGNNFGLSQRLLNFYKRLAFALFYLSPKRLFATLKLVSSLDGIRKVFLKIKRL